MSNLPLFLNHRSACSPHPRGPARLAGMPPGTGRPSEIIFAPALSPLSFPSFLYPQFKLSPTKSAQASPIRRRVAPILSQRRPASYSSQGLKFGYQEWCRKKTLPNPPSPERGHYQKPTTRIFKMPAFSESPSPSFFSPFSTCIIDCFAACGRTTAAARLCERKRLDGSDECCSGQ